MQSRFEVSFTVMGEDGVHDAAYVYFDLSEKKEMYVFVDKLIETGYTVSITIMDEIPVQNNINSLA